MHELVRAFILRPHRLPEGGTLLRYMVTELEDLQKGYDGELEIVFLKDGGFAVCIPSHFSHEEMVDATAYFSYNLGVPPRVINLAQAAGFTPPRST